MCKIHIWRYCSMQCALPCISTIAPSHTMDVIPVVEACPVRRAFDQSRIPFPAFFGSFMGACRRASPTFLSFASQNGLLHYWKSLQYTDQTFKGLYHWNWFDAVAAASVLRRDDRLVGLRPPPLHNVLPLLQISKRTTIPTRSGASTNCPRSLIQLPIFNEQFVIGPADRSHLRHRVSARKARDSGP